MRFWARYQDTTMSQILKESSLQPRKRPLVIQLLNKEQGRMMDPVQIYCDEKGYDGIVPAQTTGKDGKPVVTKWTRVFSTTRPGTMTFFPQSIAENAMPVNKYDWLPKYKQIQNAIGMIAIIAYSVMWAQISFGGGEQLSWEGIKASFWFPFALGTFICSIWFYYTTKHDRSADLIILTQESENIDRSGLIGVWCRPSGMTTAEYHSYLGYESAPDWYKGIHEQLKSVKEFNGETFKLMENTINDLTCDKITLGERITRMRGSTSIQDQKTIIMQRASTVRFAIFWIGLVLMVVIPAYMVLMT